MNKEQLLIEFMILISEMQNIAVELVEEKSYNDIGEFMEDIFSNLDQESEDIVTSISKNTPFGYVDRDKVMQEIGENQALMIFGEPRIENEE